MIVSIIGIGLSISSPLIISYLSKKTTSSILHTKDGILLEEPPPIDKNAPNAEESLQKKEFLGQLNAALETLSTREKLVVQFRYEEAMTLGEIAKMLGWEEHEAVNLHKSAIYKLRKVLR